MGFEPLSAVIVGAPSTAILCLFTIIATALFIYVRFFYVDFPRIKGIPEIPNADLLAGHLYQLGNHHALTAEKWADQFGWPVYQLRMGNRRAIMLNSFEAARDWIVKNQTATVDRPYLYTFHGVVSATSASTIGMSPWNERTKKQRRVIGSFTTAPEIQRLRPILDMETCEMISGLYYDGQKGSADIVPHIYLKRLALNIILMFCYTTRFEKIDDPLLLQILSDASVIASFRSTNNNPQDFIPHLRYTAKSARTETALRVRARRDKWLAEMLDRVRDTIQMKEPRKCVALGLIKDNDEGLTQLDVRTILGGLMSGGFETIFSTAIIGLGVLSTERGQAMQTSAYEDIMKNYETEEEAFDRCVLEEKSPYIGALVKEVLRFYPPLKLLPPRSTYKDFVYGEASIPKGILVYINAQAINRDKSVYGHDADVFRPERWLERGNEIPPPYHFSFGAGSRMCTAVNLSNRILYIIFFRLIISFRITASKEHPPNTDYDTYMRDSTASNAIAADFSVRLSPRNSDVLERCIQQSKAVSSELSN